MLASITPKRRFVMLPPRSPRHVLGIRAGSMEVSARLSERKRAEKNSDAMRCDADAVSFAFTGEGADRPNRSPSSNFGKAPPLRRQDQERGSFLPSACRFAVCRGRSRAARSYAPRDATGSRGGSIDRSDPSTPWRGATVPVCGRARGIGKAERGESLRMLPPS